MKCLLDAAACRRIVPSRARAAALNVFACEPEWGALAKELGGDKVERLRRDHRAAGPAPRRGAAQPDRARAQRRSRRRAPAPSSRSAGCRCCSAVGQRRRSSRASPAISRRASFVTLLEMPARLDRAEGDVHPAGNPHIQTRSAQHRARRRGARRSAWRSSTPPNAALLPARAPRLPRSAGSAAIARWEKQAAPLKGMPIVVHHKDFTLPDRTGSACRKSAALEPKPGVAPTAAHLAELLAQLQARAGEDGRARRLPTIRARREWLAERAKIPAVTLPFTVGGDRQGEGPVRPVRRHDRALLEGRRNEHGASDSSILLARARRRACSSRRRTCRSACRCSTRGIVFIDLAIAQIAGLGVILADCARLRAAGLRAVQVAALARRARRRAAADLDRAALARGAGGDDRRRCSCSPRPRRSCCLRATRTAASTARTCWSARSCGCNRAACRCVALRLRARCSRCGSALRERLGRIGFYAAVRAAR